jgi:hypothetical protein
MTGPDAMPESQTTDCPIFEFTGAAGELALLAIWDGKKNFSNEFPTDIINLVGGDKIAVVQVSKPVGRNGRSAVALSDVIVSCGFRGIIHWARDTETYHSIMKELEQRRLPLGKPPALPENWKPEITIMPCRD